MYFFRLVFFPRFFQYFFLNFIFFLLMVDDFSISLFLCFLTLILDYMPKYTRSHWQIFKREKNEHSYGLQSIVGKTIWNMQINAHLEVRTWNSIKKSKVYIVEVHPSPYLTSFLWKLLKLIIFTFPSVTNFPLRNTFSLLYIQAPWKYFQI